MKRKVTISPSLFEKDHQLLALPACLYLTEAGKCALLRIGDCCGPSCTFYQTDAQRQKSLLAWARRLSSLDPARQEQIAQQYYHGKMPWKTLGTPSSAADAQQPDF